jgi:hypothetical protein
VRHLPLLLLVLLLPLRHLLLDLSVHRREVGL